MVRSAKLEVHAALSDLPLKAPIRIAGYSFQSTPVVVVRVRRGDACGRGEASGVYYTGDTPEKAVDAINTYVSQLQGPLDRHRLRTEMPACGARNALDCALWELESNEQATPVWQLAGIEQPQPIRTTITLSADDPDIMADQARAFDFAKALKLKLLGDSHGDSLRIRAVRAARPDVWLGVDANQGYCRDTIEPLIAALVDSRVSLLEQPFPRGAERDLDGISLPIPIAADESCLDLAELEAMAGRFDVINIKLDKCGGLTEALMMVRRARALGLEVMVGNMMGSSLASAPAFLIGQLCNIVDLDGPMFLAEASGPMMSYADGLAWCPPEVWGNGRGGAG